MRISVDYERCEGHGMCAISAPDSFSLGDDGTLLFAHQGGRVPEFAEVAVQVAVSVCPVAALRPA